MVKEKDVFSLSRSVHPLTPSSRLANESVSPSSHPEWLPLFLLILKTMIQLLPVP